MAGEVPADSNSANARVVSAVGSLLVIVRPACSDFPEKYHENMSLIDVDGDPWLVGFPNVNGFFSFCVSNGLPRHLWQSLPLLGYVYVMITGLICLMLVDPGCESMKLARNYIEKSLHSSLSVMGKFHHHHCMDKYQRLFV